METTEEGSAEYFQLKAAVSKEIDDLREILKNLKFKGQESAWERRKLEGELDDGRLEIGGAHV